MCFTRTENVPSKFSKFIESISYWFDRRRKISNFSIYLLVFPGGGCGEGETWNELQHVMELASCVISFTVSPRYFNQWFKNGNRLGRKVVVLKSILEHLAHQSAHWAEGRKGWREEIGAEGSSDFTTRHQALTTRCPHSSQPRCWPLISRIHRNSSPFVKQQGQVAFMTGGGTPWKHTLNWTFLAIVLTWAWLKRLGANLDSTWISLYKM